MSGTHKDRGRASPRVQSQTNSVNGTPSNTHHHHAPGREAGGGGGGDADSQLTRALLTGIRDAAGKTLWSSAIERAASLPHDLVAACLSQWQDDVYASKRPLPISVLATRLRGLEVEGSDFFVAATERLDRDRARAERSKSAAVDQDKAKAEMLQQRASADAERARVEALDADTLASVMEAVNASLRASKLRTYTPDQALRSPRLIGLICDELDRRENQCPSDS